MEEQPNRQYLPHLDGLRCVALLAVLFFHFHVAPFSAGFLGVDVFFTLSGFLITKNILSAISHDLFSLPYFYIGRIHRLYPAAATVIALSVLASFLFFPDKLCFATCKSALASLFSVSNIYFHLQENYFSDASERKPLLHTWSLSLEEQFYLFWPPVIVAVHRVSATPERILKIVTAVLTLISFAVALFGETGAPSFKFFELPARFFQLSAGALLAIVKYQPVSNFRSRGGNRPVLVGESGVIEQDEDTKLKRLAVNSWYGTLWSAMHNIACFGSVAIMYFCFTVNPSKASIWHVLALTTSTLTLIAFPNTVIAQYMFATTIPRFIGRISYAGYLVHWPLYVFAQYVMVGLGLGAPSKTGLLILTFLMAFILHKTIEEKLRYSRTGKSTAKIIFIALFAVALSTVGVLHRSIPTSLSRSMALLKISLVDPAVNQSTPQRMKSSRDVPTTENLSDFCTMVSPASSGHKTGIFDCRLGPIDAKLETRFIVVGDSFVHHLRHAMYALGVWHNVQIRLFYKTSCRFAASQAELSTSNNCPAYVQRIWKFVSFLPNGTEVIVANHWAFSLHSEDSLRRGIELTRDEIERIGKKMGILTEPPGLSDAFTPVMNCLETKDLLTMNMFRALHARLSGHSRKSACGENVWQSAPLKRHDFLYDAYPKFRKLLPTVAIYDVMAQMCHREGTLARLYCELPGSNGPAWEPNHIQQVGYQSDRAHFNVVGGRAVAPIYDKLLYQNRLE